MGVPRWLQVGVLAAGGYVLALALTQNWRNNWGATPEEIAETLPGDEQMDYAGANHAITIQAPVETVWAWLAQIGQDKAGFYSYSFLENMVLADIHNADKLVPEWQQIRAGDYIRLASKKVYGDTPLLKIGALEPNHYLVLEGWGTFVVRPVDSNTTRMIIRSHGKRLPLPAQVLKWLFFDLAHFIMEREMLRGIKKRAESTGSSPTSTPPTT